jgi:hypothetical protein
METVTLRCGALHAEVLPDAAGGLGRLDWQRGGESHALLRPYMHAPGAPLPTTSQLACFPLVPWSNRIDPEGFVFEGRKVTPAPNRPGSHARSTATAGSTPGASARGPRPASACSSTGAMLLPFPMWRGCVTCSSIMRCG